ncbi:uncharacterized protein LOC129953791 [Eupeodes corollae]|uniref:uncharacterized protein LOC129953791 n=1 Tax=Eupeodes corollae TaxID=290404 RepID=UPI0024923614|nr:uncharacterized protein LOC129953791 [Eupeodes corollae]
MAPIILERIKCIILEQSSEYQSPLYLMFFDFEKGFNHVSPHVIWRSLVARGILDKIFAVTKESYNYTRCFLLHNGQLSDAFEVRQGDVLLPILFLLAIDDVMTAAVGEHERLGIQWRLKETLSHVNYAEDICLVANRWLA